MAGALKNVTFKKATKEGWDLYDGFFFENGHFW
jgi:c-di-GMP-related signal transduction protein